MGKIGFDPMVS